MPKVEPQDIDITPDPNASTTQPVQRNPTEEDVDITPSAAPAEEEPSLGAKALDVGGRALDYAGGVARVGLANSPAASMADMLQAYLRKKPLLNQPGDIGRALVGKAPRSAEYMDRAGIPEGASVSDLVPGAFTEEPGFTMKAKKGGMLDPSMRGAVGGVADMALDPLSYLGISELAKGGGYLAKLANGLRRVASPLGTSEGALANAADKAAVRHLRPTPKVAQVMGPDRLKDIGREAIDSGAIKFGQKADSTAARLGDLKDESGSLIGDIVNASDATTHPHVVAAKFDRDVIDPLRGTSENTELVKSLEAKRDAFLEKYGLEPMSASQIEAEKRAVQDNVNYLTDPKSKQKAQMGWASTLKKEGEDMIPDQTFKDAKRAYGNQAAGEMMAGRTAALTDGGNGLMGHLSDLGVGMEGLQALIHGNPAGMIPVAARGITKGRMASAAAITADKLSKLAGSKYAPAIDAYIRRKEIDNASPAPRGNVWSNAIQSQNGGNQ